MSEDEKTCGNDSDEEELLTGEQRAYMKEMIEKLMEKGIFAVFGDEDETAESVVFDERARREICGSICCSFIFALTKKDLEKGIIEWNPKRPYFIARDGDGFCPHLDRLTLKCRIWEDRPERCRNYDCRKDAKVWIDWEKGVINENVFRHLPDKIG